MANSSILARRHIRLLALAALSGDTFSQVTIDSPGDWDTPPEDLPAILLRSPDDRKVSISKGQPTFSTTVSIEIEARVSGLTAESAQDAIEELCFAIETALFSSYELTGAAALVACDTRTEVTADGRVHFGAARMILQAELPENFDAFKPGDPVDLGDFGLVFTAGQAYDSTGNHPNPMFSSNQDVAG